jgi:hypothetical protein
VPTRSMGTPRTGVVRSGFGKTGSSSSSSKAGS